MKRIALLTDGITPYVIGGMQKHSYYLVKYFALNDIQVDLYHFNQSEYDISKLEMFTELERKNINSIVLNFPLSGKLPGHYIRESYTYSQKISELLKENPSVDFIYAKGFTAWCLIEKKMKGEKFPPIGVNFHGYEMFQKQFGLKARLSSSLFKNPVKFITLNADFVFSYGGKITQLIKNLGVPEKRIVEAPTGIDSSWTKTEFPKTEKKRKFIFVGRYEKRKGVQILNSAIKKLQKEFDFSFEFIGPVPESMQIKSPKVKYHGLVTNTDIIKQILSSNDVLVCPSFAEGMPNVIMEAMACGLAVIATDVGAVSRMVDESNGWLVKKPDEKSIFQAMKSAVISTPSDIDSKKVKSLSKVEKKFRWDKLIKGLITKIDSKIKSR